MSEVEEFINTDNHDETNFNDNKISKKENHHQYLHPWEQQNIF